MKFFKKIDDYLLHFFPSLWITRVHSFLPIGLGLVLLVYLVNVSFGWNPVDDLPRSEWPIFLMIIPVLIYLVYWFIFQSRYNVAKSGGKMNLGAEYLNFFLYALVFTVAYFFILVVPFSNDQKVKNAVSYEELQQDIRALNAGNSIVNDEGSFEEFGKDSYQVWGSEFIYNDYYGMYDEEDEYEVEEILSRREVLERIENYIRAYNKYTYNGITKSPAVLLADRLSSNNDYDYYDYDYYDNDWKVHAKLDHLRDLHEKTYVVWYEPWFWKTSFALIGWLALLVWIFKQMNLRHFVFGFISICLTPLLAAIIGVVMYSLVFSYSNGDLPLKICAYLALVAYVIVGFIFIRGYLQNRLNQTAYVSTMYFHFWVPILPFFVYMIIMLNRRYDYYYYYLDYYVEPRYMGLTLEELIYWMCIGIGVLSLIFFKPIYTKYRSLPMQK